MAKKRRTPADPEPTPLQAYLAALRHRPPDPAFAAAYTAVTARLGPERAADFAEAQRELALGRLALMARRIAFHKERQQMLAIHAQIRERLGLPRSRPRGSTSYGHVPPDRGVDPW
jgi:hypothetical protein